MRRGTTKRLARLTRLIGASAVVAIATTALVLGGPAAVAKSKRATKPTVAKAKVAGVGAVLVDSDGKTLYTLTNGGTAVDCTGQCANFWPPLMVTAGTTPKGGKGVKGLGVSATDQVTVKGLPVYRFMGDAKAGQASGEGISSFGGVWHVVKASGTSTSTKQKSTPSSSYGY
jgi:predicted lipoprotein with Yx(FWY)xxD motif